MPQNDQYVKMKWVLFWIFISLYTIIVIATFLAIFYNIGNLQGYERKTLFYTFLVETGIAISTLFYALFELKKTSSYFPVRLIFLGERVDERKYSRQIAKCAPRKGGVPGSTIECEIQYRNEPKGLFIFPKLPAGTDYVFVTVGKDDEFEGFFEIGRYRAELNFTKHN